MIIQLVIFISMIIVGIGLIVLGTVTDIDWYALAQFLGILLILSGVIWGVLYVGRSIEVSNWLYVYKQQENYIETYTPKNDIENAALTNTKIELNNELYTMQYLKEKFGKWSLISEKVLELEPIQ